MLAADEAQGFLLLTDLGDALCLPALQAAREQDDRVAPEALMRAASARLLEWQQQIDPQPLPPLPSGPAPRQTRASRRAKRTQTAGG